jgi:hypothetical protein
VSDRNRNVVAATGRVGDVGEQERAPLVLGKPAPELPAHQRPTERIAHPLYKETAALRDFAPAL